MCSSGGQVAADDQALQDANLKANTALTASYTSSMGQQSQILGQLNARMAYQAANPMGYTPQQLHLATTSINENTSRAAKQAIGSAAAFAASHGAADVGGGGAGAMVGQIASQAAQAKSGQLAELGQQNEALKQENMWKSLGGLQQVGADYGGAAGQQISGSLGASGAGVSAGQGVLDAKAAGWNELSGVLGGISGLAQAAVTPWAGAAKGCWIAAAIYGGWLEPRTILVRTYIFGEFSETWYGHAVAWLYMKTGQRIAKHPWIVQMMKPIFDAALRKAQKV